MQDLTCNDTLSIVKYTRLLSVLDIQKEKEKILTLIMFTQLSIQIKAPKCTNNYSSKWKKDHICSTCTRRQHIALYKDAVNSPKKKHHCLDKCQRTTIIVPLMTEIKIDVREKTKTSKSKLLLKLQAGTFKNKVVGMRQFLSVKVIM